VISSESRVRHDEKKALQHPFRSPCGAPIARLALAAFDGPDLRARVQLFETELTALRQQLRDEDDGRLLRALAIGACGCVFSVSDILTRAQLDPVLAAAVGSLRPKQLGKRLARLVGHDIHGLTVRRVLLTADGWM
jgi:hypothetical protein